MNWKEIKERGVITVSGKEYDLAHLNDVHYRFTVEATKDSPDISFGVQVLFSSHCVSWGAKNGTLIDFHVHGRDRRIYDHRGQERCFCEDRYELSKQLPDIFSRFLDYKCFFTGHGNWLLVEIVDDQGNKSEYEVYFDIKKGDGQQLVINVESAYIRNLSRKATQPNLAKLKLKDKVKAKVLAIKKLKGETIRAPRKSRQRKR